jgi:hypothetical protein
MPTGLLPVTAKAVEAFWQLFVVNQAAFTIQSDRPHPESDRHYYFQSRAKGGKPAPLEPDVIRRHLAGFYTIGLYAIDPIAQCCRWLVIDADYGQAITDLLRLQYELERNGLSSALERSRRGGHLWLFLEEPTPAQYCRLYMQQLAESLQVPLRSGQREGIEIFPKHDTLREGQFGNAIRGPFGIHRQTGKRYWFYGANYGIEGQLQYLSDLPKVQRKQLERFAASAAAMRLSKEEIPEPVPLYGFATRSSLIFRILDYVKILRTDARNHWTQCPSCAAGGRDSSRDNLAISVAEPLKYRCWAGCSKEEIRAALGQPIPPNRGVMERRS